MENFTLLRMAVCGIYIYMSVYNYIYIYISLSPEFRRTFL